MTKRSNKLPRQEFHIGDVVRISDNEDSDDIGMIVGVRLRYFSHMRRHIYFYELADRTFAPVITNEWLSAEDISPTVAETDTQKWRMTKGEIPVRKMIVCSSCNELRIDDFMDCPYCSAEREIE